MATREIIALDTTIPQLLAPQTGDTYLARRTLTLTPEGSTPALVATNGNILVGTSATSQSANCKIVVSGTNEPGVQFASTGNGGSAILGANGGGMALYTYTGAIGSESFVQRMLINSAGDVGIGTSTPGAKLDVGGAIAVNGVTSIDSARKIFSRSYTVATVPTPVGNVGAIIHVSNPTVGNARLYASNGTNYYDGAGSLLA